uniref:Uncharacterized protein n=1 Tax=Plectus sambesii TaxID=2011161 RepID=A0A914X651_9BILA
MTTLSVILTVTLILHVTCYPLEEQQPKRRVYKDIRDAVRDMWPMKRGDPLASSFDHNPMAVDFEQPTWMESFKRSPGRRRITENDIKNLLQKAWIV